MEYHVRFLKTSNDRPAELVEGDWTADSPKEAFRLALGSWIHQPAHFPNAFVTGDDGAWQIYAVHTSWQKKDRGGRWRFTTYRVPQLRIVNADGRWTPKRGTTRSGAIALADALKRCYKGVPGGELVPRDGGNAYSIVCELDGAEVRLVFHKDDTLAGIGFRLQQLSHLAARTSDPELRKQYLSAKREVELERLEYLRGSNQGATSAWPGYGYPRPGE